MEWACSIDERKNTKGAQRRLVDGFPRLKEMERAKGFEPSTPTLARLCSTPELHPHAPYSDQIGGARRDRTADLLHAMQALSQLSYGPNLIWQHFESVLPWCFPDPITATTARELHFQALDNQGRRWCRKRDSNPRPPHYE